MLIQTRHIFFCVGMAIFLYGCLKPEVYPAEPVIKFKSFKQVGDSGVINFTFTDGDGDIGLTEDDIEQSPYVGKFVDNVFIGCYEKVDGEWLPALDPFGNPVVFTYRIQPLAPSGKHKALKGEFIIYMYPYYIPGSINNDTIKMDIQMADRAIHLSNIVETGEIYPQE